jgi:hypothetical protein
MTKLSFAFIFLPILLSVFGRKITPNQQSINTTSWNVSNFLDSSKVAILPLDAMPGRQKDWEPAELSAKEITTIENLLTACINKHNSKEDSANEYSEYLDLKIYKFQFVPYLSKSGAKKVLVNCFCKDDLDFSNWRKEFVIVMDGGRCYWHVTINLSKKKCEMIYVNGDA